MTKFKTLAEVKAEKIRLIAKKEIIEEEIKMDFEELKESLTPMNLIKNVFKSDKVSSNGDHKSMSPLVSSVAGMAIDLLLTRVFMRNSSFVKKLITSYIIRTTGPGLVEKAGPSVVAKISSLIGKFLHHKNGKGVYDQTTASDIY